MALCVNRLMWVLGEVLVMLGVCVTFVVVLPGAARCWEREINHRSLVGVV